MPDRDGTGPRRWKRGGSRRYSGRGADSRLSGFERLASICETAIPLMISAAGFVARSLNNRKRLPESERKSLPEESQKVTITAEIEEER